MNDACPIQLGSRMEVYPVGVKLPDVALFAKHDAWE